MADRAWIDELLGKVELIGLISGYVPLKRKGRTYWGCCPFHHEKEPSFAVNEEKQFYHCFGCKESGNAITFIEKMENVDFIDAVKILAEKVHMEVPERIPGKGQGIPREKRDRLYSLLRAAAKVYHENLSDPRASNANQYLTARGIDSRLITRFGLGVSLGWDDIIIKLEKQGFTRAEMKEAGLAEMRGDSYYDVFKDRVIFPIVNNMNEVTGFGGRTLEKDTNFAKYRNTSQTPVFDKSKTIYAINLLKKRAKQAPIDYVIMAEGYMDVIALHKAGFDTAVASMGTALTWDQAKMLKNFSRKVYISYDGDAAGQKAALRGLDILAAAGLIVRVVKLPDGMDPDDVIKEKGAEGYKKLLSSAVTLTRFKLDTLVGNYDLTMPDEKAKYAVEALRIIKALDEPIEREDYIKHLQLQTGYSLDALMQQAEVVPAPESPVAVAAPVFEEQSRTADNEKGLSEARTFILASFINNMDYVDLECDLSPLLEDDFSREIYSFAVSRMRDGTYKSPTGLFSTLPDRFQTEFAHLLDYQFVEGDGEAKFRACVQLLKKNDLIKTKQMLADRFTATKDISILTEIRKIDLELSSMKE